MIDISQNNDNKYSIINSQTFSGFSNKYNDYYKYPFAHNPLSNLNFKDQMVLYQQNGVSPTDVDVGVASAGIIVSGTMLAGLGALTVIAGPLGVIGAIVISFGTLLPILFPDGEQDTSIWNGFMQNTEELLKDQIANTVKETALANLKGLNQVLSSYQAALDYWIKLKKQQFPDQSELRQAAQTVKIRFEIAHNNFVRSMPSFQMESYRVLLLSTYAQAANLHLNLLQQGVQFADQWNKDQILPNAQREKESGTSSGYYDLLSENIPKYSAYCTETYQEGLNIIKETIDDYYKQPSWNQYNSYRTYMTLTILDVIALFPNYDTKKYPMSVESELTREIYQTLNLEGLSTYKFEPLEVLENNLTRKPDLFTWLSGIYLYENNISNPNGFFNGHFNQYYYTNFSLSPHTSPVFGNVNDTDIMKNIKISPKFYIYMLYVTSLDYRGSTTYNNSISKIMFFVSDNTLPFEKELIAGSGVINQPINQNLFGLPPLRPAPTPNYDNYSSFLTFFKSFSYPEYYEKIYSFAWSHYSVNQKNNIYRDKISQIPAVKACLLGLESRVIQGPGHTGGNLINLTGGDFFTIKCHNASSTEQSYFIRLRYASNGDLQRRNIISYTVPGISGQSMVLNQTFSGTDYNNLQAEHFGYLEFVNEITLPPNLDQTFIFNRLDSSDSILIIDKIEFLPLE
ncbi:insecticidal delta-endotoxin Cry8Ea1 family protein [Bacillus zhangzhouensis]